VCTILAARAWPPEYYLLFPFLVRFPVLAECLSAHAPADSHVCTLSRTLWLRSMGP